MKPEKQETLICQHSVSEETGNSKVQTNSFGAINSKFSLGGLPPSPGGGGGAIYLLHFIVNCSRKYRNFVLLEMYFKRYFYVSNFWI